MVPEFKYQTIFDCTVPADYVIIKSFSERIQSDELPTADHLLETINASFADAQVGVKKLSLSQDERLCEAVLDGDDRSIYIHVRVRPSLVVGDNIYKLEEFDI